MRISTKGRYGLRALVDLASNVQEGAVSLINVAQRQKISLNYLEQVFATLRKAGIVKSQKEHREATCWQSSRKRLKWERF